MIVVLLSLGTMVHVQALKAQGYRIVTTALSPKAVPITELDFTQPTAFVLGNEVDGVGPSLSAESLNGQSAVCRPGAIWLYNSWVSKLSCPQHFQPDAPEQCLHCSYVRITPKSCRIIIAATQRLDALMVLTYPLWTPCDCHQSSCRACLCKRQAGFRALHSSIVSLQGCRMRPLNMQMPWQSSPWQTAWWTPSTCLWQLPS